MRLIRWERGWAKMWWKEGGEYRSGRVCWVSASPGCSAISSDRCLSHFSLVSALVVHLYWRSTCRQVTAHLVTHEAVVQRGQREDQDLLSIVHDGLEVVRKAQSVAFFFVEVIFFPFKQKDGNPSSKQAFLKVQYFPFSHLPGCCPTRQWCSRPDPGGCARGAAPARAWSRGKDSPRCRPRPSTPAVLLLGNPHRMRS